MERLVLLSQDKDTLLELRSYLKGTLERKLIDKAMKKDDVSGFAEAFDIIKVALDEIDSLSKKDKVISKINQSE